MAQPPPLERNDNGEENDNATSKFRSLLSRLLAIDKKDVDKKEKEYQQRKRKERT